MPQRIIQLSPDLLERVEDEAKRRKLTSSADCIILVLEEALIKDDLPTGTKVGFEIRKDKKKEV